MTTATVERTMVATIRPTTQAHGGVPSLDMVTPTALQDQESSRCGGDFLVKRSIVAGMGAKM